MKLETGFLQRFLLETERLGKNPVSQGRVYEIRNRVFAEIFVRNRKIGKKPGLSGAGL